MQVKLCGTIGMPSTRECVGCYVLLSLLLLLLLLLVVVVVFVCLFACFLLKCMCFVSFCLFGCLRGVAI